MNERNNYMNVNKIKCLVQKDLDFFCSEQKTTVLEFIVKKDAQS